MVCQKSEKQPFCVTNHSILVDFVTLSSTLAYELSNIYAKKGDIEQEKQYLAIAAIADLKNAAVTEGKLIHYTPSWNENVYVYARIKGNDKVLVILNGSPEEQSLSPEKYREVIGNAGSGKDIISGKTIDLKDQIVVPAKGVYIIEL